MALAERRTKDGKTVYQVRIWVLGNDGRNHNRVVGTFTTKRDARTAERNALLARERGQLVLADRLNVGELLDQWMAVKTTVVSANSKADYDGAIRLHLKPKLGSIPVQRLSATQIQQAYTEWQAAGMSARMVRRQHVVLGQALGFAVKQAVISRSPASDVTVPRIERSTPLVWTPEETRRFLDLTLNAPVLVRGGDSGRKQPDGLTPLWHLLAVEGMRRGEALGLRWSDIGWDRGVAHISQTVAPNKANKGKALILPRTKTVASSRTVRLTAETLTVLHAHRDRQQFQRQRVGDGWHDLDLIVTTGTGEPVNPGGNISRSLDRLCKAAGVPRIRVHDLRHGAATLLLRAGVPLKMVSERLGHASISITGDLYSHVAPDMQDVAADAMTEILKRKEITA